MSLEKMKVIIRSSIHGYPVTRIVLFGSRAAGTNRDDSDVDLIIEFSEPITLLPLTELQLRLEEALKLEVDIVHGPIRATDFIEIGKEIVLYAA